VAGCGIAPFSTSLELTFFAAAGAIMSSRLLQLTLTMMSFGARKSVRVTISIGTRPAVECIKTSSKDFSSGALGDFSTWGVDSDFF
jgi:hypothetical protein